MNSTESPSARSAANRARNAFILALILAGATGLILTLSVMEDLGNNGSPFTDNNLYIAIPFVSALVSLGLSRTGRVQWAAILLGVGIAIGGAGSVTTVTELGLVIGSVVALAIVMIANITATGATANWLTAFGAVAGVTTVLLDLYWPGERGATGLAEVVPYILGGLLLGFTALVFRQFRTYSLRGKLILLFLAVSLIPVAIMTTLSLQSTRANLTTSADQSLLAAASQTAVAIDTFISGQLDTLRTEAQIPVLQRYLLLPPNQRAGSDLEQLVVETLRGLSRRNILSVSSYALLDSDGLDVMDTFIDDIGIDKSDRNYFINPRRTGLPYVSPLEFSRTTGQASIYFAAPVRDAQREVIGVLRVRYSAAVFQDILRRATGLAGPASFATLLDENYIRVAHGGNPDLIGVGIIQLAPDLIEQLRAERRLADKPVEELFNDLPTFATALEQLSTSPFFRAELHSAKEGRHVDLAAVVQIRALPWFVVYSLPEEVFLAPVTEQTRVNTLVGLAIAAVVVLAAFFAAQILAAPITRLTAVAAQVRAGDLQAQARVETEDEIGVLATTFNSMTAQLRETLSGLEERVADRTRALATSAQVSRRLSTILDQKQLATEVVEQLQGAFNYYHAHIYLFDAKHENLLMVGGTGEAGRTLLARGHSIPRGRGLVGRAADTNAVVLVADTAQAAGWLPNPLLPETKAEVAVPIAVADEVLGVLDVQQNRVGGLTAEDAELIRAIADQVAIALRNIRSYDLAQRQAENETLVNTISQQIQGATTVEAAIQVTIRELGRALKAPLTTVRLLTGASRSGNGQEEKS